MRAATLALGAVAAMLSSAAPAAGGASLEVTTDDRRRGLSWSDGRPSASARAYVARGGLTLDAAITATRGGARHPGADAAIDLGAGYRHGFGAWRLGGGVIGHVFPGAGRLDYVELEAGGGVLAGPVQLDVTAAYAPSQAAIGGDNLYVSLGAVAAVPTTPLTILAGVGRSSGDTRRSGAVGRLRPGGDYTDYWIGLDHVRGPLTLGIRYTGTGGARCARSTVTCDRHTGNRLSAQARLDL